MKKLEKISQALLKVRGRDLKSYKKTSRKRDEVTVRSIVSYIMRKDYNMTYEMIGDYWGQDHTTVMYSVRKVEDWLRMPQQYSDEISLIKAIRTPSLTAVDIVDVIMGFWDETITQNGSILSLAGNTRDGNGGFLVEAATPFVVPMPEFVRYGKRVAQFFKQHNDLLTSGDFYVRSRNIDDNIELCLMTRYDNADSAIEAAMDMRLRTIYNTATKQEEQI